MTTTAFPFDFASIPPSQRCYIYPLHILHLTASSSTYVLQSDLIPPLTDSLIRHSHPCYSSAVVVKIACMNKYVMYSIYYDDECIDTLVSVEMVEYG